MCYALCNLLLNDRSRYDNLARSFIIYFCDTALQEFHCSKIFLGGRTKLLKFDVNGIFLVLVNSKYNIVELLFFLADRGARFIKVDTES